MGALHDGHRSLIQRARRTCGTVVVSLFVNPLQFSPAEDYRRYPRDLSQDLARCREENVDLVFVPKLGNPVPSRFSNDRRRQDVFPAMGGRTATFAFSGRDHGRDQTVEPCPSDPRVLRSKRLPTILRDPAIGEGPRPRHAGHPVPDHSRLRRVRPEFTKSLRDEIATPAGSGPLSGPVGREGSDRRRNAPRRPGRKEHGESPRRRARTRHRLPGVL